LFHLSVPKGLLPKIEIDQLCDDGDPGTRRSVAARDLICRVVAGGDDAIGPTDVRRLEAGLNGERHPAAASLMLRFIGDYTFDSGDMPRAAAADEHSVEVESDQDIGVYLRNFRAGSNVEGDT
jgi:hypothetical protein